MKTRGMHIPRVFVSRILRAELAAQPLNGKTAIGSDFSKLRAKAAHYCGTRSVLQQFYAAVFKQHS